MNCRKCGEKTEEQFDFCTECGEKKEEKGIEEDSIEEEARKEDSADEEAGQEDSADEGAGQEDSASEEAGQEGSADEEAGQEDSAREEESSKSEIDEDSTKDEDADEKSEEKETSKGETMSLIKRAGLIFGVGALALLVVVLIATFDRSPNNELDMVAEEMETGEEAEGVSEEPEEIYIPEGALYNDYIVILQHKGLPLIGQERPDITDDDVERVIQMELAAQSTTEEVTDRPAEDGDLVTIDFAGSVDGEYFDGGTSEGHQLLLGSGTFIGPYGDYEGFEEQIIGHNIGDNFDITIQFPSVYHAPHLAGVVANFNITIHAITETITPELTDEWVQENSDEATTVEEYREVVKENLILRTRMSALFSQQHEIFQALIGQVVVIEIPDWAIENEVTRMHTLYQNLAAAEGMEFEEFLMQVYGMDEATFIQEVTRVASETAVRTLAISLIREHEDLELTEEEVAERIEELARFSEMESVEAFIEALGEDHVQSTVVQLRVAEFLIEHAVLVQ